MSTEPIDQVLRHITDKKHILITTRANPGGDAVASALAFYLLAQQLGKRADCVIGTEAQNNLSPFSFLPGFDQINYAIPRQNHTTIEFQTNTRIKSLTYQALPNTLLIRLQTDDTALELGAPRVMHDKYPYDAIVVVDAADLDSLGTLYRTHAELFYHTPIINIDHDSDNEHFGELNLVELTAVSTTEIIATLIKAQNPGMLTPDIATCLLAGIMLESKSFQTPHLTPRSLELASALITAGARREEIVAKLYANKSIGALQMWGRALSKIKTDPAFGIIWSVVELSDLEETGASSDELLNAIEHFLTHVPNARAVILVHPHHDRLRAIVHTHIPHTDLRKVLAPFHAYGTKSLVMCEAVRAKPEHVVEIIKNKLAEHWRADNILPQF